MSAAHLTALTSTPFHATPQKCTCFRANNASPYIQSSDVSGCPDQSVRHGPTCSEYYGSSKQDQCTCNIQHSDSVPPPHRTYNYADCRCFNPAYPPAGVERGGCVPRSQSAVSTRQHCSKALFPGVSAWPNAEPDDQRACLCSERILRLQQCRCFEGDSSRDLNSTARPVCLCRDVLSNGGDNFSHDNVNVIYDQQFNANSRNNILQWQHEHLKNLNAQKQEVCFLNLKSVCSITWLFLWMMLTNAYLVNWFYSLLIVRFRKTSDDECLVLPIDWFRYGNGNCSLNDT